VCVCVSITSLPTLWSFSFNSPLAAHAVCRSRRISSKARARALHGCALPRACLQHIPRIR
jgi:hypothetical protein